MLETNPFTVFCPAGAKYLVLGSFASKDGKKGHTYDWYYSNGRNQFWPILELVYETKLRDRKSQQKLFTKHKIAIADIIKKCRRVKRSSLDTHLTDIVYNKAAISTVFNTRNISKVLFTSRFVETHFRRNFRELVEAHPKVEFVTLPSPSPRYARMTKEEKIKRYKQVFPHMV